MIVYRETKQQFLNDVYSDFIEKKIEQKVYDILHKKTPASEKRSWSNSMQYMYRVLQNNDIPYDVEVAIEYRIPNSNKRIDFIVSGEDLLGNSYLMIIELKQWDEAYKVEGKDAIVLTRLQGRMTETVHPSYQAWSYSSLIEDYNECVRQNRIILKPCAYLHNYQIKKQDPLIDECYKNYISKAPIFSKGQAAKLSQFIFEHIKKSNDKILEYIENGKIMPSKSLQDSLTSMLKNKKEFNLIDEQKIFYEKSLNILRNNFENKKKVYIIHGGPGTGKTILAINILVSAINENYNALYITKNTAPREVYRKKLTQGKYRKVFIDNLFRGSGSFHDCESNVFDCLIVDEAHRLNEKSGMFQNIGENQVKEIINCSKCSIFFVDDKQMVTTKDIGNSFEIKKWANFYKADIYEDVLFSQFRCNGSDSYINWIEDLLEIDCRNSKFDGDYDFRVIEDPNALKELIFEKNKINNKSRIVAGYCWDWIKTSKNNTDVHDIVIGDFSMSWNLGSSSTWAIDENSVNEIGCIHTCQGLEFDYVGVIIGPDLRYDNGIITDFEKRAKTDQSIKGLKSIYKENKVEALSIADKIIKNTYRTLLTRGQKGCYVYCIDKKLQKYIIDNLKKQKESIF